MVGMGHIHHCCFQPDSSTWSSLFLRTSAACLSWKTSRREKSNLFLTLPAQGDSDDKPFSLCIWCTKNLAWQKVQNSFDKKCKPCFTVQPSLKERCHPPDQPDGVLDAYIPLSSVFIWYGLIILSNSESLLLKACIDVGHVCGMCSDLPSELLDVQLCTEKDEWAWINYLDTVWSISYCVVCRTSEP